MSRSNNTELKNPATRFIEWKGGDGKFQYYDKDTKANIDIPLPFRFIVLDQLTTIKGYCDADESGYWSNEIRDLATETLVVRTKKGKHAPMLYEQVKEKLGSAGADYCKSVYIGYYDVNKKLVIGNISIKGCAIGPWIDFCKSNKVMEIGVQVKVSLEGKKGKTVFKSPVFEPLVISKESNEAALLLDKELQQYLSDYFKTSKTNSVESQLENDAPPLTKEQEEGIKELEFEREQMGGDNPPLDDLPF